MKPRPPISITRNIPESCLAPCPSHPRPAVAIALLGLFLCGCAAESELLRLDTGLTPAALRSGNIAVLGVVKFQEPDQVRPPLIAMLERAFAEERRDIRLIPADSVRRVLGSERHRRILLAYEYQGAIEAVALREIADSLRGIARFAVAARVEKDKVRSSARGAIPGDTASLGAEYAMGVTGRDARVRIHLFDLEKLALVMDAKYAGSSENTRPVLTSRSRPAGGTGTTVEVGRASSGEQEQYPDVPDLARALEEPFRAFARTVPGGAGSTRSP